MKNCLAKFVSSHYDGVTCISQRVWINCEIGIQSNGAVTKHEPCEGPRTGLPVRLGSALLVEWGPQPCPVTSSNPAPPLYLIFLSRNSRNPDI